MKTKTLPGNIEASINVIADATVRGALSAIDRMQAKVKKTLLSQCRVYYIELEELGTVEVYARTGDFPKNGQTDETEIQYRIECVKLDGEEITLNREQMDECYSVLENLKS